MEKCERTSGGVASEAGELMHSSTRKVRSVAASALRARRKHYRKSRRKSSRQ
jgi:hypothetical protein